MEHYIVSLDSEVYPDRLLAEAAIAESGAEVIKHMSFGLTFQIEATAEQIDAIPGVTDFIEYHTQVDVVLETVNTDHLKFTVDLSGGTEFTPENTGEDVHIYLADTGIQTNHAEFADATVNELYTGFSDFTDTNGHGTAVASLISGKTVGVAPDATLHIVKLFQSGSGEITLGEILEGLNSVLADHQQRQDTKPAVLCTPWNIAQNNFLDAMISEMQTHGIIVVAAAGNSGVDVATKSPAGVLSAVTVGSFNRDLEVTGFTSTPWSTTTNTGFVNYGAALDIFALGVDVSVADHQDTESFKTVSGTSASAGIVAGVIAHFIEAYPDRAASDIKEIVLFAGAAKGGQNLVFDETDTNTDYSQVFKSIATTYLAGKQKLSDYPTGRLISVQAGQVASMNVKFNPAATDITMLDFAPLPPWISLDTATGELVADTTELAAERVPGIYYFALRGKVDGTMLVTEWSVGVYQTDSAELEPQNQDVFAYYYDIDLDEYDQIVEYSGAFIKQ